MRVAIRDCWCSLTEAVATFGRFQIFFFRLLPHLPQAFLRPRLIVEQIYAIGALSLVLIMFAGLFVGMVLALQAHHTLSQFGATDSLGAFAAVALVRELGPVVAALLYAGRAGTAVASEVGLMRATDQIAALEMMAVDPVRRIVVPRFIGGVISMPLLAAIFSVVGIFGAYLVGVELLGVDAGAFWSQMQSQIDVFEDVGIGLFKSFVFGVSASLMGVFEGFNAIPTAAGVSRATTRTVVITSVWVLLMDFLITALVTGGQ